MPQEWRDKGLNTGWVFREGLPWKLIFKLRLESNKQKYKDMGAGRGGKLSILLTGQGRAMSLKK